MKRFLLSIAALLAVSACPVSAKNNPTPLPGIEPVAAVVTNALPYVRTDKVEVDSPFDVEKVRTVAVVDGKQSYPAQVVGDRITFVARSVPAKGCKLVWLQPVMKPETSVSAKNLTVENEYLRATIDRKTGAVASLYDKSRKREIVAKGSLSCALEAFNATAKVPVEFKEVDLIEAGPTRAVIRAEYTFSKSSVVQDYILYENTPRLDVRVTVAWQEEGDTAPSLEAIVPASVRQPSQYWEMGGGVKAASKWVNVSGKDWGVSLMNDGGCPCSVKDNSMSILLVGPDKPAAEGLFDLTYSIVPQNGAFDRASMDQISAALVSPLRGVTSKASSPMPIRVTPVKPATPTETTEPDEPAEPSEPADVKEPAAPADGGEAPSGMIDENTAETPEETPGDTPAAPEE